MTVVRERPTEVRRCFSLILVAPLVIVSCLAQEGPKEEASLQGPELSDKQVEQVAEILGIDQGPLQETLTWLAQEEVPIRDAIIFVIFAQKRTLRQVGPTTITTDQARQVFQNEGNRFNRASGRDGITMLIPYGLEAVAQSIE